MSEPTAVHSTKLQKPATRYSVRSDLLVRQSQPFLPKTRRAQYLTADKLALMAATMLSKSPAFPSSFADADAVARTHFWYSGSISDRKTLMLPCATWTGEEVGQMDWTI